MTDIHYPILDHIEVPSARARDFDPAWAEVLAAIIKEQGLLHPIRVRADGDSYRLIAGRVRLDLYLWRHSVGAAQLHLRCGC